MDYDWTGSRRRRKWVAILVSLGALLLVAEILAVRVAKGL